MKEKRGWEAFDPNGIGLYACGNSAIIPEHSLFLHGKPTGKESIVFRNQSTNQCNVIFVNILSRKLGRSRVDNVQTQTFQHSGYQRYNRIFPVNVNIQRPFKTGGPGDQKVFEVHFHAVQKMSVLAVFDEHIFQTFLERRSDSVNGLELLNVP